MTIKSAVIAVIMLIGAGSADANPLFESYGVTGYAMPDFGLTSYELPLPPTYGDGVTGYYNLDVPMTISPATGGKYNGRDLPIYFGVEFQFAGGNRMQMGLLASGLYSPGSPSERIAKFYVEGDVLARTDNPAASCYDRNSAQASEFNTDGDFATCNLPFNWQDHGDYKLRIWSCCGREAGRGESFGVWVIDGDDVSHMIGIVSTPSAWGRIDRPVKTFVGFDYWNYLDNELIHYDETNVSEHDCIIVADALHWTAHMGAPVGDSGNDALTPPAGGAVAGVPEPKCQAEAVAICGADNRCVYTFQKAAEPQG